MVKFLNTFSFLGGLAVIFMGLTVVLGESINHQFPTYFLPIIQLMLFAGAISAILSVSMENMNKEES